MTSKMKMQNEIKIGVGRFSVIIISIIHLVYNTNLRVFYCTYYSLDNNKWF